MALVQLYGAPRCAIGPSRSIPLLCDNVITTNRAESRESAPRGRAESGEVVRKKRRRTARLPIVKIRLSLVDAAAGEWSLSCQTPPDSRLQTPLPDPVHSTPCTTESETSLVPAPWQWHGAVPGDRRARHPRGRPRSQQRKRARAGPPRQRLAGCPRVARAPRPGPPPRLALVVRAISGSRAPSSAPATRPERSGDRGTRAHAARRHL